MQKIMIAARWDLQTLPLLNVRIIVFKASPRRRLGDAKASERVFKWGVAVAASVSRMAAEGVA